MSIAVNRKIAAAPDAIWAVLTDARALERADNNIRKIEGNIHEGATIRVTFEGAQDNGAPLKVITCDAGRELRLQFRMPLGFIKATFVVYLMPVEEGTDVELSAGVGGWMGRKFSGKLDAARPAFERFLASLEEEVARADA